MPLEGVLTWPESAEEPLPGLLLVHGGAGLDDHARAQATRYAALGYTVLAADMFGPGVAGNRERVVATLMELRDDPAVMVRRATAGLSALAACPEAFGCFAAVGFCFGGMVALALARAGVDIAGVVSIHGSLRTAAPARNGAVKSRVLVCHGSADPHVPFADVSALIDEMGAAGADWQLLILGGALHGFTHRDAVAGATPGVAFDEAADRRSFDAARLFLSELHTAGSPG
jgi:dienelactone hydrolase